MNQVAGFDIHRGVLASATRPALLPPVELLDAALVVAVLEGINDHENMGVDLPQRGRARHRRDRARLDELRSAVSAGDPRVDGDRVRGAVHPVRRSLDELEGFTLVALSPER